MTDKLSGVHPDLVTLVKAAQGFKAFSITEGLRSLQRQKDLVAAGKSKTMNSRHLGGFAVDTLALVEGKASWDFEQYFGIAEAFKAASVKTGIPVQWGGCWETLTPALDLRKAVEAYKARMKKEGRRPLLDGVHFQLPADRYPNEPTA